MSLLLQPPSRRVSCAAPCSAHLQPHGHSGDFGRVSSVFEGTGLVVPPFAELPAGGRVTRWKLVPGVTSKDAVGVAVFALAGSVSAFGKEKGEKCLVAPGSLQKSSSSLRAARAFGSSKV